MNSDKDVRQKTGSTYGMTDSPPTCDIKGCNKESTALVYSQGDRCMDCLEYDLQLKRARG